MKKKRVNSNLPIKKVEKRVSACPPPMYKLGRDAPLPQTGF
jgi:hypothetical protein